MGTRPGLSWAAIIGNSISTRCVISLLKDLSICFPAHTHTNTRTCRDASVSVCIYIRLCHYIVNLF